MLQQSLTIFILLRPALITGPQLRVIVAGQKFKSVRHTRRCAQREGEEKISTTPRKVGFSEERQKKVVKKKNSKAEGSVKLKRL